MLRSLIARLRPGGSPSGPSADVPSGTDDADEAAGTATDESADGEEPASSVWDFIPDWQYGGRHVESGGLQRDEQERALRDVQRQAAEIEASENEPTSSSNE